MRLNRKLNAWPERTFFENFFTVFILNLFSPVFFFAVSSLPKEGRANIEHFIFLFQREIFEATTETTMFDINVINIFYRYIKCK